jgi:hypothetical protein
MEGTMKYYVWAEEFDDEQFEPFLRLEDLDKVKLVSNMIID